MLWWCNVLTSDPYPPCSVLLFYHTYAGYSVLTQVCVSHDHPGSYVTCRFPHAKLPHITPFGNVSTCVQHDGVPALHGSQPLCGRRETSASGDTTTAAGEVWPPPSAVQLLPPQPRAWEQQPSPQPLEDSGGWGVWNDPGVWASSRAG